MYAPVSMSVLLRPVPNGTFNRFDAIVPTICPIRVILKAVRLIKSASSFIGKSFGAFANAERTTPGPETPTLIAVTPIAMLLGVSGGDPLKYAQTLEKCAQAVGVNFLGGFSALVQKGFSAGDERLL